jgi:uncharacterized membrane protein YeaQ/YmgE (transglycosylase-associated protein family)
VDLGDVVSIVLAGLIIGALGRLAVPGPDPMPLWLTILFGVVGAFVGGGLAIVLGFSGPFGILALSVGVATVIVIAYRRIVQRRSVTGPGSRL